MKTMTIKALFTYTLIATGFATAGFVFQSNQRSQPSQVQRPHGLSYGEVWQITRVEKIGPDILVEE